MLDNSIIIIGQDEQQIMSEGAHQPCAITASPALADMPGTGSVTPTPAIREIPDGEIGHPTVISRICLIIKGYRFV